MVAAIFPMTEAKARAAEIRTYAEQSEHWYRAFQHSTAPGNIPEHILESGTVRAVFSWTMVPDGKLYRQLSVSSLNPGGLPKPLVVWTLAHYFGFTGAVEDEHGLVQDLASSWDVQLIASDECVMVVEEIEEGSV